MESLFALVTLLLLPLFVFSVWLWQLGRRCLEEERFPPAGTRVIGRIAEVRGQAARRRGRLAQVCATIMLAAGTVLLVLFWRLLSTLDAAAP